MRASADTLFAFIPVLPDGGHSAKVGKSLIKLFRWIVREERFFLGEGLNHLFNPRSTTAPMKLTRKK